MNFGKSHCFFIVLCAGFIAVTWAQSNEFDGIHEVSSSLNQFALTLLSKTSDALDDSSNLAISPYTVWSLLTIIAEGAKENTARELEDVLKIPPNDRKGDFRNNYKSLTKHLLYLKQPARDFVLDLSSSIFIPKHRPLRRQYETTVKNFYSADVIPTDFNETQKATKEVNDVVARATRNRIQNLVRPEDLYNAEVPLLLSTMFFKGQWKFPFNNSATFSDTFFDTSQQATGRVNMMYQMGPFPYIVIKSLKAQALELPYGEDNRLSMIVILPRKGESLSNVLKQMANIPFSTILNDLAAAEAQYGDENILVYLPRFTISSELMLNSVLYYMGIKDLFDFNSVNLLGMFHHYLYVSRVIHTAIIEVNEDGIAAPSAVDATSAYEPPSPKFYANRNFAYMIVDRPTQSIIFAGKVSNPNKI